MLTITSSKWPFSRRFTFKAMIINAYLLVYIKSDGFTCCVSKTSSLHSRLFSLSQEKTRCTPSFWSVWSAWWLHKCRVRVQHHRHGKRIFTSPTNKKSSWCVVDWATIRRTTENDWSKMCLTVHKKHTMMFLLCSIHKSNSSMTSRPATAHDEQSPDHGEISVFSLMPPPTVRLTSVPRLCPA